MFVSAAEAGFAGDEASATQQFAGADQSVLQVGSSAGFILLSKFPFHQ